MSSRISSYRLPLPVPSHGDFPLPHAMEAYANYIFSGQSIGQKPCVIKEKGVFPFQSGQMFLPLACRNYSSYSWICPYRSDRGKRKSTQRSWLESKKPNEKPVGRMSTLSWSLWELRIRASSPKKMWKAVTGWNATVMQVPVLGYLLFRNGFPVQAGTNRKGAVSQ